MNDARTHITELFTTLIKTTTYSNSGESLAKFRKRKKEELEEAYEKEPSKLHFSPHVIK